MVNFPKNIFILVCCEYEHDIFIKIKIFILLYMINKD